MAVPLYHANIVHSQARVNELIRNRSKLRVVNEVNNMTEYEYPDVHIQLLALLETEFFLERNITYAEFKRLTSEIHEILSYCRFGNVLTVEDVKYFVKNKLHVFFSRYGPRLTLSQMNEIVFSTYSLLKTKTFNFGSDAKAEAINIFQQVYNYEKERYGLFLVSSRSFYYGYMLDCLDKTLLILFYRYYAEDMDRCINHYLRIFYAFMHDYPAIKKHRWAHSFNFTPYIIKKINFAIDNSDEIHEEKKHPLKHEFKLLFREVLRGTVRSLKLEQNDGEAFVGKYDFNDSEDLDAEYGWLLQQYERDKQASGIMAVPNMIPAQVYEDAVYAHAFNFDVHREPPIRIISPVPRAYPTAPTSPFNYGPAALSAHPHMQASGSSVGTYPSAIGVSPVLMPSDSRVKGRKLIREYSGLLQEFELLLQRIVYNTGLGKIQYEHDAAYLDGMMIEKFARLQDNHNFPDKVEQFKRLLIPYLSEYRYDEDKIFEIINLDNLNEFYNHDYTQNALVSTLRLSLTKYFRALSTKDHIIDHYFKPMVQSMLDYETDFIQKPKGADELLEILTTTFTNAIHVYCQSKQIMYMTHNAMTELEQIFKPHVRDMLLHTMGQYELSKGRITAV